MDPLVFLGLAVLNGTALLVNILLFVRLCKYYSTAQAVVVLAVIFMTAVCAIDAGRIYVAST